MQTATIVEQGISLIWQVDARSEAYATLLEWMRLREAWLSAPKGRGQVSEETRRSYAAGSALWLEWLAGLPGGSVYPWEARAEHARAWQAHLRGCGLVETTINQRLAVVSSWYEFFVQEGRAGGSKPRVNPFRKLRRSQVRPYGKARPLSALKLRRLFDFLEGGSHTARGARNHALLLTYFLTGCRASEVVSMRWGDIRESRGGPDAYVWAWMGKGGKAETTALPARCYEAIRHYVRLTGREMAAGEFIWQAVSPQGVRNLRNHQRESLHISARNAARIFRGCLRAAGVEDWRLYRLHDLRHTFAHMHHNQFHDLPALRRLLHHESIATTDIYVREMADPVDEHSEALWSALNPK